MGRRQGTILDRVSATLAQLLAAVAVRHQDAQYSGDARHEIAVVVFSGPAYQFTWFYAVHTRRIEDLAIGLHLDSVAAEG
jgi:hypothetical protein